MIYKRLGSILQCLQPATVLYLCWISYFVDHPVIPEGHLAIRKVIQAIFFALPMVIQHSTGHLAVLQCHLYI